MTSIRDAFEAGDLPAALAAATAAVRAKPREAGLRWLLAEMLLFSGQVERADRALDAVIERLRHLAHANADVRAGHAHHPYNYGRP